MFRILLVDDEEDYLTIGEEFLTDVDQDFEVVTSTSAQQAIQILSKEKFDAIVADYSMPEMDGLELLETLRNDGNTIPFVIFTRHNREEVAIRALNLGADYYLTKGGDPVSQYSELAHIIRSAILHKRTEAALLESEEKFRALADQSLMGILIMQSNKVVYTNKALADFMGYSLEEILAWSVSDFIEKAHPDDLGFALSQYQKKPSGDQDVPPRYNLRLITKGGATRWVTISSQEIQLMNGPAVGALIADNTEQRLAEQWLRESEEKFRVLADQSLVGIAILQENKVIYANKALTELLGYSEEDLLSWDGGEFVQAIHPEDREFVLSQNRKKLTGDSDTIPRYEIRVITKSGETKWAMLHSQAINLKSGPALSASIVDISEMKLIDRKLRESEERFRDLANLLPSCIFEADLSGNLTYANRFARELFGYTQEDFDRGVNVLQFFAPDDRERLVTNFQRKLSGEMLGEEGRHYHAVRKDGSSFPSYIYTSPITQDQKPIGLRGILIDNTEQKEAENALRESEEKYRALVENIPIGLSRTTPGPNGEFLMANPALVDLLGFDSEDSLKQISVADIYATPSERIAFSDNLLAQGGVSRAELQYKKRDGTPIWGTITARVVHDVNEEILCFDCAIEDITEQKRADEALRESEERYRELIEKMLEGMVVEDTTGCLTFANPRAAEMLGCSQEELIGKHWSDLVPSDEKGRIHEEIARRPRGISSTYETILQRKDGQGIPVIVNATPLFSSEKTFRGVLAVFTDITDRKKAEEELRKQKEELSHFARAMSHDLRNSLHGIQGYAKLVEKKYDQSYPEKITNYVNKMNDLLHRSVELADAGLLVDKTDSIDLTRLVRNVADSIIPAGIDFTLDPLPTIVGDRVKVVQIFQNLFENAVRHGKPDRIQVTYNDSRDGFHIHIMNDGEPIPSDYRSDRSIFQLDFGAQKKGRGIGMTIISRLVEAHGWQIFLEPDNETTFRIFIPAND